MIALALQAATAFNLICTGVQTTQDTPEEPYQRTFRIDLQSQRWCMNECTETNQIASVTNEQITLAQIETAEVRGFLTINRESGRFLDVSRGSLLTLYARGQCERAAFTGFPARRF